MNITFNSKTMGIAGAVLLAVGAFLPFVSVPIFGSISYVAGGRGDGLIIVALSGLALFLVFSNRFKALWFPAIASSVLVTFSIVSVFTGTGSYSTFVSLEIAPLVIYGGAALLGWVAKVSPVTGKRVEKISLFSMGYRTSSILVVLGTLVTLSAPLVLAVLHASITNPSFDDYLMLWVFSGGFEVVLFCISPIVGLLVLRRGYPLWSLIGSLYGVTLYIGTEESYFESVNRVLTYEVQPLMSFVYLIPVFGSVLYALGALVATWRQRTNQKKE